MDNSLDICPTCGGPADNGNDRCVPPSPYECVRCDGEKKFLYVEMYDGTWRVPVKYIAADRARYYSRENPEEYEQEYRFGLSCEEELMDWAVGNMNWSDVERVAELSDTSGTVVDREDDWVNGVKWVA